MPIPNPMASESTPPPSFVKQAMRNMVRKGSKSLFHFGLTACLLYTSRAHET